MRYLEQLREANAAHHHTVALLRSLAVIHPELMTSCNTIIAETISAHRKMLGLVESINAAREVAVETSRRLAGA